MFEYAFDIPTEGTLGNYRQDCRATRPVVDHHNILLYQGPEQPLPPSPEDTAETPTLKRILALRRPTLLPPSLEDTAETPTLKRVPALRKPTLLPHIPEDVPDSPTPDSVPVQHRQVDLPSPLEDRAGSDSPDERDTPVVPFPHLPQQKPTRRKAVIVFLLVLIASATIWVVLIFRQYAISAGLTAPMTSLADSRILLGLCIVLAIAFTVAFNIISRINLSTTRYEGAYTILWQFCCALLVPFFLPFDRFSINVDPHVLLLVALSVVLWALVDAFLFSAFKYEEASTLSVIFPLNFVFTFVVSLIFFHSIINPAVVVGFLIIMAASVLIGVYHIRLRPSKGILFALLYSFFLGAALGFNSEVVKNFSIPPYMFIAFLFPALANLLIFLRPKVAQLRYEFKVQWKQILLNAAVMDISFFFLLKAFQLGNVPQVVAFSASSTLLTALAGVVFLKEDKYIALKIIAAALATLGIILVQL